MCALVDLQVLGAGKHFSAPVIGTREGLLARMHSDVVHQLVLGLEGTPVPTAAHPEARVDRALGSADVLHRQMRHYVLHRVEGLAARLPVAPVANHRRYQLPVGPDLRVDPHALHLLLELDLVVRVVACVTGERAQRSSSCSSGRSSRVHGQIGQRVVMGELALVVVMHRGRVVMRMDSRRMVVRQRVQVVRIGVLCTGQSHAHLVVMVLVERVGRPKVGRRRRVMMVVVVGEQHRRGVRSTGGLDVR